MIPSIHPAVLVTGNAGDKRARAAAQEIRDELVEELLREAC